MKLKLPYSKILPAILSLLFSFSLVLALPATTLANSQAKAVQLKLTKAKITLDFQAPKNKKFEGWYKGLKSDKQLKQVIAKLIPIIGLNVNIHIVFRDDPAGRGPFYEAKTKTIYFSYQFIQSFRLLVVKQEIESNKRLGLKGKTKLIWTEREIKQQATYTTYEFVTMALYHELAHAIIRIMKLPIVGNNETAADNLAVVLIIELNSKSSATQMILSTVDGLAILSRSENQQSPEHLYADTHGMGKDRQRQFLCLASAKLSPFRKKDDAYIFNYAFEHQAECKQAYAYQQKMWLGLLKHGYVPVKHSSLDGKISLEMKPAISKDDLTMKRQLESDAYFQSLLQKLNKFLKLSRDIKLTYYAGSKDSVPTIDVKQATIKIPYSYLVGIAKLTYKAIRANNKTIDSQKLAHYAFSVALNNNLFLVVQQLAYLIMDFNQLPVVGSKLLAADNLSAIILLNFIPKSEIVIMNGIIRHLQLTANTRLKQASLAHKNKKTLELRRLESQYDQAVKREYNILCLMSGKNPSKTLKLLNEAAGGINQKDIKLLQEKKRFCHYEYKFQLKFWMKFLI